nr:GntR family transcriptional regulator [Leifsonia psychrotolerans]
MRALIATPTHGGFVPLHHQVYAALSASLDKGEWAPGDRMPTESDLAQTFECSLITVRRALDELVRERRIVRMRGKGTFACTRPLERDLAALTSFTDEMRARGLNLQNKLVDARLSEASSLVADHLGIEPGSAVYRIERVRLIDGEPLLLEEVQIPAHLAPGLLETGIGEGSLYDILADVYGLELTHGQETLEPSLPSTHEAALLEQDRRAPVLLLEMVSFTKDDIPVEYCRSVVRGDRARYRIEIRRQRAGLALVTNPDD